MPRPVSFSREQIGAAALDLVRREGWDALTARGLAAALGTSVAPIYGAFEGMEDLQAWVLGEASRLLSEARTRPRTDSGFLNNGIGLVLFARDEPKLFLALYRAGMEGELERHRREVRSRMKEDAFLASLEEGELDRIFDQLWTYTLGMILDMLFGRAKDRSEEGVAARLRSAGSLLMYGVLSGLDEDGSAAARERWTDLFARRGWTIPPRAGNFRNDPAQGR